MRNDHDYSRGFLFFSLRKEKAILFGMVYSFLPCGSYTHIHTSIRTIFGPSIHHPSSILFIPILSPSITLPTLSHPAPDPHNPTSASSSNSSSPSSKNLNPRLASPPQALSSVKKAKCPPVTGLAIKCAPGHPPLSVS